MIQAPAIDAFLTELEGEDDLDRKVAPLVRRYLDVVREYLVRLHRESRSGRVVNESNSDCIDRLLRRLFVLAEDRWLAEGNAVGPGLCVVAVGGYARREMSIHSDVDLLVLYRESLTPYVAQIAEVSVDDGVVRVHKITCAFDLGMIMNPLNVEAQTVGCIVNGLTAAFYGEITLRDGRVVQSNFHDYQLLPIDEMPEIDVHLIDSTEEPGGAGEPPLPATAPAVTNAVFARWPDARRR